MNRARAIVDKLIETGPDEIDPQKYLGELPERIQERWVFTDAELADPKKCKRDDEFVTLCDYGEPLERQGVIVYRDGRITNRWADGTAGVPDDIYQAAADCEAYYDPRTRDMAEIWRNVYTDEEGNFIDWA